MFLGIFFISKLIISINKKTLCVVTIAMICSNLAYLWKFQYFRRPIYNPIYPGGSTCSDTGSKKRKALKKVGNGKEPVKKKAKEAKKIYVNLWQHKDIQNADDLSRWTFPGLVQNLHDSSVTLFELFMTDKLIDHICKETNTYAAQKGSHTFKIDSNEMKSFLAVLLLSGYIPYARRFMYLEMFRYLKHYSCFPIHQK